jgi:hypothetical protein
MWCILLPKLNFTTTLRRHQSPWHYDVISYNYNLFSCSSSCSNSCTLPELNFSETYS